MTLIFTNGTVTDTWMKTVVKANATTGLAAEDVFYFAHLTGEADGGWSTLQNQYSVGSDDLDVVRGAWGAAYTTAPGPGDLDADKAVNSNDLNLIRGAWGNTLGPMPAPARGMAASSSSFSSSESLSRSSTPQWTAEADKVYADYGMLDDDPLNDLAIDEKFWERLYEALGLKW